MAKDFTGLESAIGYRFNNKSLVERAFTHPSLTKEGSNQRLEFLGDSVLGLVVSEMLYDLFPNEPEGELAPRLSALVCTATLAQVAEEQKLGDYLLMAGSEEKAGGRQNSSNLEDACEALIGALYLDGGIDAAKDFILPRWKTLAKSYTTPPKDAKTQLQEWAQARGLPLPEYAIQSQTGPSHAPEFTVTASLNDGRQSSGVASSKRGAEQLAAEALLKTLPNEGDSDE